MRCLILLLLAGLNPQLTLAQRPIHWYIGPTSAVTTVHGEAGVLTGLEGGVMPGERLAVGFETWRLLNAIEANQPDPDGNRDTEFFFSGLTVAYAYPLSSRMSLAPSLLVGGAEAHWRKGFFNGMMGDWRRDDEHTTSIVLMPGTSLNYTLAPWLRAVVGAHYRFVAAGESHVLDPKDMRGFAGSFGFRLGRFQPISGS